IPSEGKIDPQLQDSLQTIESKEAAKMLDAAKFYERRHNPQSYDAAVFTYREILRRYPNVPQAATAKERLERLEKHGQPAPDIGERKFSLPVPKVNLPKPRLKFWAKAEEEETEAEDEAVVSEEEYPELDVAPIKSRLYVTGDVVIDMDAEEAKLRNFESGAAPEALEPIAEGEEQAAQYVLPEPQVSGDYESVEDESDPLGKETIAMEPSVYEVEPEEMTAPLDAGEETEEILLVLPAPETVLKPTPEPAPERVVQAQAPAVEVSQDGWTWSEEFNEE
ncbi:MAG: hypothetical protein JXA52_09040, partial [Planctomycetes bacterium]|nr:hypothetical protein [Planctomycetota bacterium]